MMQIGYLRVQHILDQDVDGIFGPKKNNLAECFQSLTRYYDWLYNCRELLQNCNKHCLTTMRLI